MVILNYYLVNTLENVVSRNVIMKIAVLGSGDGAHAVAFEWASAGHDVYMYDFPQHEKALLDIVKLGGIYSVGIIEGFQQIKYAGSDLEKTLLGADIVFLVGAADCVDIYGRACSPFIADGQLYVVVPSSCMGALSFKNALGLHISDSRVVVAETSTLPYTARVIGPAKICVFHKLPAGYKVAAIPRSSGKAVYEKLRPVFNGIELVESVFQTTLQNNSPICQPVITTLNAALLERTDGDFFFFKDGVTPAVGNIMRILDQERIAIAHAMDLDIESSVDIGVRQGTLSCADYTLGYKNSSTFDSIIAQSSLDYRFYNEDLGYAMVFWIDLANKLNVKVPMMRALVEIVSGIMMRNYMHEAPRTLETLGLSNYTIEELKSI